MAEVNELSDVEKQFLHPHLPIRASATVDHDVPRDDGDFMHGGDHETTRPHVTLTYASSLDSMIALAPGVRTTLSGPETKNMTHYLRLHHDAILVGVGTALADDPSLSCRYPGATLDSQPRPVIVDPEMRWDVRKSKVCALAIEGKGKAPWVIQKPRERNAEACGSSDCERLLVGDNGLVSPLTSPRSLSNASQKIYWRSILRALKQKGIDSVMIEGGATIINDLLSQPELVDSVVLTIAPTWLGQGGVTVSPAAKTKNGQRINAARLEETSWRQFGQDAVLGGRLKRED